RMSTVGGVVGGIKALTSLTTDATGSTQVNGGAVTTTASQTYNDTVTVKTDTTFTGTNVTFTKTLNADAAAVSSNVTVNASGITTFGGVVGGIKALKSLTTDAAGSTDLNGGNVTTTGAQTYNDAVVLSADATLQTTNGNIAFLSTLDSDTSTARNLTLTTL